MGLINIYNALGIKIRKTVTEADTQANTEYLGSFQYNNNTLQYIHTAEGYVRHTPPTSGSNYGAFDYVYNYTDHLGNVRLSYTLDPSDQVLKILEENHYYPFGMKHSYNTSKKDVRVDEAFLNPNLTPAENGNRRVEMVSNTGYQYRFNQKEWQDELALNVYDYGARRYDPAVGRWMNIDPLAETFYSYSNYIYCKNNPVYFIDPDGRKWTTEKSSDEAKDITDIATALRDKATYNAFVARFELEIAKEQGIYSLMKEALDKIDENLEMAQMLTNVISDIKLLGDDETFNFEFKAVSNISHRITRNGKDITIEYEMGKLGIKFHETTHAAQFLKKKPYIGFGKGSTLRYHPDKLHYAADYEVEAYKVQYSFCILFGVHQMPHSNRINSIFDINYKWLGSIADNNNNNPYDAMKKAAIKAEEEDNKKRGLK